MFKVGDLVRPTCGVKIYLEGDSIPHVIGPEDVCLVVQSSYGNPEWDGDPEWIDVWVFRLAGTAVEPFDPNRFFEKVAP